MAVYHITYYPQPSISRKAVSGSRACSSFHYAASLHAPHNPALQPPVNHTNTPAVVPVCTCCSLPWCHVIASESSPHINSSLGAVPGRCTLSSQCGLHDIASARAHAVSADCVAAPSVSSIIHLTRPQRRCSEPGQCLRSPRADPRSRARPCSLSPPPQTPGVTLLPC